MRNDLTMGSRKRRMSSFNAGIVAERVKSKLLHFGYNLSYNYVDYRKDDPVLDHVYKAVDELRWVEWELYRRLAFNKGRNLSEVPPDIQERRDRQARTDAFIAKLNNKKHKRVNES